MAGSVYMVASGGTIGPGVSTNLVDWVFTDQFSGSISFGAVCASRTQFCLFGTVAEIYTSPGEPLTFTQRTSPSAGSAAIASCDHDGAGVVLAGGGSEGGTRWIYYSTDDGDTWARVDSGLDRNITVVRGIPGHYVAFGQDGRIATATDVAGPWTADNSGTALSFDRIDDALFESDGTDPTGRLFASGRVDGTAVTIAAYSDDYGATWTDVTGLAGAGSGNARVRIAQDLTGSLDNITVLVDTNDVVWKNSGVGGVNFTDALSNYSTDAWGPIQSFKFLNGQFIFLQNGWGIQEGQDTLNVSPVPATDIGATTPIAPTGNPGGPDGIAFLIGSTPPPPTPGGLTFNYEIPDPRLIGFYDWACRVVASVERDQPILAFPPNDETFWKEWARQLYYQKAFTVLAIPSPDAFDDWREWGSWVKGSFS